MSEVKKHELSMPPPVLDAKQEAHEMLRVWAVDGKMACMLNLNGWEPSLWGIALVDIARHIASGHFEAHGTDRDMTMAQIKRLFDAEWAKHTSAIGGGNISGD